MNFLIAVILILISSVFGAFSTLFFKQGAMLDLNFKNKKLFAAFFLAGISFLFYIYALKQAPLTFIYLTASVSYIWAVILARVVLKENLTKPKIIGIILIFLGIVLIQL